MPAAEPLLLLFSAKSPLTPLIDDQEWHRQIGAEQGSLTQPANLGPTSPAKGVASWVEAHRCGAKIRQTRRFGRGLKCVETKNLRIEELPSLSLLQPCIEGLRVLRPLVTNRGE